MSTAKEVLSRTAPDMRVHFPSASGYSEIDRALEDVTHLVFASHADDDVLLGAQGISDTYRVDDKNMGVIVVSADPGTGRPTGHEDKSNEEMIDIRWNEQMNASNVAEYALSVQLGYLKKKIKGMEDGKPEETHDIIASLSTILQHTPKLENLYLHSIFDAHDTHIAIDMFSLQAAFEAVQGSHISEECNIYGVEVSTGIALLPPEDRVLLPVNNMDLVTQVLLNYETELDKRAYHLALFGRAIANDTFNRDKGKSTKIPHLCAIDYREVVRSNASNSLATRVKEFKLGILGRLMHTRANSRTLDQYAKMGVGMTYGR